jgi:hypothetical protein
MNRHGLIVSMLVLAAALLTLVPNAWSTPLIAARSNMSCGQCHVNPYGGEIRNSTGFFFGKDQLALEATIDALNKKYKDFGEFAPVVGDKLQFGADARVMFLEPIVEKTAATKGGSFLLMETALYADAHLLPILHLTAGYDPAANTLVAYGLVDSLPAGLFVQLGRFVPVYGVRIEDHTVPTRDGVGFGALSQDNGLAVGINPVKQFYLMASVTNGLMGQNALDNDGDHYAFAAKTGVRFWKVELGASGFYNVRDGLDQMMAGPHLMAGIWKFSYVTEADITRNEIQSPGSTIFTERHTGWAVTHLLEAEIIRGLSLQACYGHVDQNWDAKDDQVDRISGGINLIPIPFLETNISYRHNQEVRDKLDDQIIWMTHLYF